MGVLLAVYQKLTLRKRIDRGQYELMMLSEKQNQIQRQMSDLQQRRNDAQNIWDNTLSNISTGAESIFQAQLAGYNQNASNAASIYSQKQLENSKKPGSVSEDVLKDLQQKAIDAQNQSAQQQSMATMQYQMGMQRMATAKNAMEKMLGKADENTLRQLQQLDSEYSQKKELKEQQLTKWNQEYENVGKLADQEAKNAAPKFGLG